MIIDVKDLKVSYDGKHYALDGISFNVKKGEIFGFLGPNGAGKTTTIRVLTTLIKPTSGTIKVFGLDVVKHGIEIRKRIGVILQQPSYEWSLSVEKNLDLYGMLWNIPKKIRMQKIPELMKKFDLWGIRKKSASELSIGERRRLQVVRELIHDAELLFLDEPTIGLDPIVKKKVLDYFRDLAKRGMTIFFTTHNLEEADHLCNRVGIINKGRIYAIDTIENLKKSYEGKQTIELKLDGSMTKLILDIKNKLTDVELIYPQGQNMPLKIVTRNVPGVIALINEFIKYNNEKLLWLSIKDIALEDVFFDVITGAAK